jgi:hypothetical protein
MVAKLMGKIFLIRQKRHVVCFLSWVFRYGNILLAMFALVWAQASALADVTNVAEELRLLREQNALLQQQVQKQDKTLDTLNAKIQKLEAAETARSLENGENLPAEKTGYDFGTLNISAEGGAAFFNTGSQGSAPHSEFRVDEARVFLESPVWDDVYFYGDIDLATRENSGLSTQLGELYLDFENVSQIFGKQEWASVRAGRMQIPFGEEYQNRYAMENSLISHSLSDIWGIDPGIELYGKLGKFSYAVAVQNGGGNGVDDFTADKSVAGKICFDPNPHWHFSLSAMRTGEVDASNEYVSGIWFGNAWFRSIGSDAATRFHADLVEGDVTARWKTGRISGLAGYARYGDNNPATVNSRNIYYYSVEVEQNLPRKFYVAARFSQIFAPNGYPLAGFGNYPEYFTSGLTANLWRVSLGAGYRFNQRLALKLEYALEHGRTSGGDARNHEDFIGTEAVFRF